MKKLLWSEPQIAEIEVRITDFNKVGFDPDSFTPATNGDIVGDICPNGSCS
ncbi:MAG: hypothetical protein XE00_0003 [Desulfofundulus kuznetsovii]|nr:MAG: hypothetical protein XD84_0620 [Desulfotomaculum sp. 46_80]KUK85291.1 MAG: hypothetical protein XE00_0003 [Desulfofundulus kuznetsovii]